jgi:hypothetical protein
MRGGGVVWLVGLGLLVGVTMAGAHDGQQLDDEQLQREINRNRALASYVARNGLPDVAATSFLADQPPWDEREVTLYYLDRRKEIAFARAWILGEPSVQIVRYERSLSDADVAALQPYAMRRGERLGDPALRAEAAARRAETAANRVEAAADVADRAADRAEAVASKMERGLSRSLRK